MKKILFYTITALLILGLWAVGELSYQEFTGKGSCPHFGVIPVCYLVLGSFVIPLISHITKKAKPLFYLFSGLAFLLAIFASSGQLSGRLECPKTSEGTPMCYISFFLFLSIISLKIIYQRLITTKTV